MSAPSNYTNGDGHGVFVAANPLGSHDPVHGDNYLRNLHTFLKDTDAGLASILTDAISSKGYLKIASVDTTANRPAASAVEDYTIYYASDDKILSIEDGSDNWIDIPTGYGATAGYVLTSNGSNSAAFEPVGQRSMHPLAVQVWQPSEQMLSPSASFADVSANNARIAFTTPTGITAVLITLSTTYGTWSGGNNEADVYFQLRDSGVAVASTDHHAYNSTEGNSDGQNIDPINIEWYVSGLTASTAYDWDLGFKQTYSTGTNGLLVGDYTGTNNAPPLIMKAYSLPSGILTVLP